MKKCKILIGEDEIIIAHNLKNALEIAGFNVCDIGMESSIILRMVEMHHPDLVILDINLAGSISGIEVARVLKNKLNIPFVLMSGYSDLLTKEVIEELQPLCALSKPIDYAKLIQCVEENAGEKNR